MTLPFDICTSLWLTSIPKWEWEPEPAPECAPEPEVPPADEAAPAVDGASFAALPAPRPPPSSDQPSKPGYRLVFKGFEMAGRLFWLPADSPVSRPWVPDADQAPRRRRAEPDPVPKPELDPPSPEQGPHEPDWEQS